MSKSKRVSEDTVELNENIENDEENFGEAFAKLKFLRKIKEKANKVKGDHADSDENDEIDENKDQDKKKSKRVSCKLSENIRNRIVH